MPIGTVESAAVPANAFLKALFQPPCIKSFPPAIVEPEQRYYHPRIFPTISFFIPTWPVTQQVCVGEQRANCRNGPVSARRWSS